MLNFPNSTEFNKRIPKQKFYENIAVTPAMKRAFVEQIRTIYWRNKIVFHEGAVRHIYFVAETKGTMESLNLRPIEKSKIDCAKKLFAKLSDGLVTYDHVDSYQELMNKVLQ